MTLLEVGRIHGAHGVRGEVMVDLVTNRTERLAVGTTLQSERGPLTVLASRPHKGKWIVAFAGVSDRNEAEALGGLALQAEPVEDPGGLWVHDLIGAEVVDSVGTARGHVVAVEANPAADLLVLDTGYLVPVTFVVDAGEGAVVVDVPDGLFD